MSVVTTTRAVRSEQGDVEVRVIHGDVVICWYCGETRTFAPKALKGAIEHLKDCAKHPEATVKLFDKRGNAVTVRLLEGKLFTVGMGSEKYVDFGDLRRAIKLALKAER